MAKKFNFRLDSVLKLRHQKVNEAISALSQATHVRTEKEREITNLMEIKADILKELKKNIKAEELQIKLGHKTHIENQINKLTKEKEKIIEIENNRRNRLTKAMTDEKALENLKEKKKSDHDELIKKEEEHFLNEVSIEKHMKQNGNKD